MTEQLELTSVDDSVLGHYAELGGIRLDDLELDSPHAATDEEGVALAHGAVG